MVGRLFVRVSLRRDEMPARMGLYTVDESN